MTTMALSLTFLIGSAYIAFQFYALITMFNNPRETPFTKLFWFAVIFGLPFLGSFIYLYKDVSEKKRMKRMIHPA